MQYPVVTEIQRHVPDALYADFIFTLRVCKEHKIASYKLRLRHSLALIDLRTGC